MHHISEQGTALIKQFEGFSPVVYRCPAGIPTIGFGHVVGAGEHFPAPISEAEAETLLKRDVRQAEQAVSRLIAVPLSNNQFDALVSFTYNLGAGALQRSTLRRKLNRGDYDAIPGELMKWVRAGGRILPGLVRRRTAEGGVFSG